MQLRPYQIDALSRSKEAYDKGINRQLASSLPDSARPR